MAFQRTKVKKECSSCVFFWLLLRGRGSIEVAILKARLRVIFITVLVNQIVFEANARHKKKILFWGHLIVSTEKWLMAVLKKNEGNRLASMEYQKKDGLEITWTPETTVIRGEKSLLEKEAAEIKQSLAKMYSCIVH